MDPQRERIQADLSGIVAGQIHCDDFYTQLYATDASLYEIRPLAVIRPRSQDDVIACVRYAAEHGIAIHARGAGTGLAGESLGPGLVLDFSHAMRRILEVAEDTVTIQPGVVHGQLNRLLARDGRMFGPDPATGGVTTMGSVIALDGGGSRWLAHGSARRHVVSLTVVTASGEVIEAAPTNTALESTEESTTTQQLARRTAELVRREQGVIEEHRPKSWVNRGGYQLHDVLQENTIDMAKLFVGSEGTLGIITQATVKTVPIPGAIGQVLCFFDRLEPAAVAANEASGLGAAACDLMDRRILTIARDVDPRYASVIPREAEAMLLVEFQGETEAIVRERVQQTVLAWRWKSRLAFASHIAIDAEEMELFRRLVRRVVPTLSRIKGNARPVPLVEDIAVPPDQLAHFFMRLQNVLKKFEVTASLFGHVGHGQLHIRPFLDPHNAEHVRIMPNFVSELYEEVLAVGGTISGEHAAGLSRTWFFKRQFGPLYDVFREVKRIFDPQNILNPGKVVADVPQPLTKNLRTLAENRFNYDSAEQTTTANLVALHLNWNDATIEQTSQACNGCGRCRTQSPEYRMCPTFRSSPAEEASPRAKANLLRGALTGALVPYDLSLEEAKHIADSCVNCHQCRLECPVGVDIPRLVLETKAQFVAMNGLSVGDWLMARIDWLAAWSSIISPITNWALGNRAVRWSLERLFGIAQTRKLPRVSGRSFIRWAHRRKLTKPTSSSRHKVLYFVDMYANWFDTELAEACVNVLQHNGVSVYVHPAQQPSLMARITMGDVERSRLTAFNNVRYLAEAIRQGYEIVTAEPSAALCLQQEYVHILGSEDARLVAEHTHEATHYLWQMHREGLLELNFKPLNVTVGYHVPCHMKALTPHAPGAHLLSLIPGLSVQRIEKGCSGMAGTFGLKTENFRQSLRIGFGLIAALRDTKIDIGSTECSACKMQMEQGTTKPTVHPLKLLALSYGLMPQLVARLQATHEELIVS